MNGADYFSTLARYNAWATRRLLDAVAALPEADYRRDAGLFFKSIHGTLNHLLVGEHLLWFRRFAEGVSPRTALDDEAEPDRVRLARRLLEGAARWQPLIETWPAERLDGTLDYVTTRGVAVSLPLPPPWPTCSTTAHTTAARSRRRSRPWASPAPSSI
jgi:uncharacterized damage-inducible protein DinB